MYTTIRVLVWKNKSTETYYLFSPTLGSIVASGFESKSDAERAAARFGATAITKDDLVYSEDFKDIAPNLQYLCWWVEICDFNCVREGFRELLYHEACIRKNMASESASGVLSACSMSVATSLMLENISKDLGQSLSSDDWLSCANWKLDRMLENGSADVRCDLGCIRLDN